MSIVVLGTYLEVLLLWCPSLGSVTVISNMTKSILCERKGFFWLMVAAYHEGKSGKELKVGVWRQELKQRPWKSAAFSLALCILFSVLSCSTEDHLPRGDTAHNGLDPPTPI